MNKVMDPAVRNVLEVMDRTHRRVRAAGWLTVAVALGSYAWFAYVAQSSPSVPRLISAAVLALTSLVAWAAYALAVLVLQMGRRILRAIELASATRGGSE
jgi:hypothetical protein